MARSISCGGARHWPIDVTNVVDDLVDEPLGRLLGLFSKPCCVDQDLSQCRSRQDHSILLGS